MIDKYLLEPFDRFFKLESASGILLFFVTIIALVWANSPAGVVYRDMLSQPAGIGAPGFFTLQKPVILWVNDGLMTVFFFLIGLEIKREVICGELNSLRKASLPLIAAIGGIILPVSLFFFLNKNPETSAGWGIPMATDIAFSLAVLKLLGKRVPLGLKVFLTAFAIVDDLAAVLAIAVLYTADFKVDLLLYAGALLALLFVLSARRIYSNYFFLMVGGIVWVLFLKSGIHPTIAGVLMAFTIPLHRETNLKDFFRDMKETLSDLGSPIAQKRPNAKLLTHYEIAVIDRIDDLISDVQSPLQILEHRLHGWVAYFILPVFALANAGILFRGETGDMSLALTIGASLVLGKFLGIFIFTFVGVRFKLCDLPSGVRMPHVAGVGLLAGIGFTMSIFIANLAYTDAAFVNASKIGVLVASLVAGVAGSIILRFTLSSPRRTNFSAH